MLSLISKPYLILIQRTALRGLLEKKVSPAVSTGSLQGPPLSEPDIQIQIKSLQTMTSLLTLRIPSDVGRWVAALAFVVLYFYHIGHTTQLYLYRKLIEILGVAQKYPCGAELSRPWAGDGFERAWGQGPWPSHFKPNTFCSLPPGFTLTLVLIIGSDIFTHWLT